MIFFDGSYHNEGEYSVIAVMEASPTQSQRGTKAKVVVCKVGVHQQVHTTISKYLRLFKNEINIFFLSVYFFSNQLSNCKVLILIRLLDSG